MTDIISGKAITEGTEEKDLMEVVYCRGFKKLLALKNCNAGCRYFLGLNEEPVKQRDGKTEKIIRVHKTVACGYPRIEPVMTVCEVK